MGGSRIGSTILALATLAIVVAGSARSVAAADLPLAGKTLLIRNRPQPEDATKRRLSWSAVDASVVSGARGTSDDPRCIGAGGGGGGGTIRFFSDGSGGSTQDTGDIALPCENWTALGTSTDPKGYAYKDREQDQGPCRRVVVLNGKRAKAICTGKQSPLGYDLVTGTDEGKVATLLRTGAGIGYCTEFDDDQGKNGSDGKVFRGKNAMPPSLCPAPPVPCGDGDLDAGEQCDDGNTSGGDGCTAGCQIEGGYECVGAPSVCTPSCSDGTLDAGEQCDDGNTSGGDGCTAGCQIEAGYECAGAPSVCTLSCSDGTLDAGEQCDDGNTSAGDGCTGSCQIEAGYVCAGEPSVCEVACGNGAIDAGEGCDDGNVAPGDGCNALCQIEPGWACSGEPSTCLEGCGDGILSAVEQCDDGNTSPGDGCAADCTFEPLCLVTNNPGSPGLASVVKVSPDGTLLHMGNTSLPGNNDAGTHMVATRCGRRVYMALRFVGVAGFDVGLDGTLTPLPTLTGSGLLNVHSVICNESQGLLFTLEDYGFNGARISSFTIGVSGELTPASSVFLTSSGFDYALYADLHPTTQDLFVAPYYNPPLGGTPDSVDLARVVYDTAGNLAVAERVYPNPAFPPVFNPHQVHGIHFTADAGALVLPGYLDAGNLCFAHFDAPGTTLQPFSALNESCGTPFPSDAQGFVPRPEGGPFFYYQSGSTLNAGELSGASVISHSSIAPVHVTNQLLVAFGGRVLVSLGRGSSEVATYDVASDLVTLTPNDTVYVGTGPASGVLIPCPDP